MAGSLGSCGVLVKLRCRYFELSVSGVEDGSSDVVAAQYVAVPVRCCRDRRPAKTASLRACLATVKSGCEIFTLKSNSEWSVWFC